MRIRFFDITYILSICGCRLQFVLDLRSQLSHSFDGDLFVVVLMAVDGKQQVGYQSCKDLNHKTVFAPCNQVIYLQVPLPPGEEVFNIPPEFIGCRYLFSRKVMSVVAIQYLTLSTSYPTSRSGFFVWLIPSVPSKTTAS